MKKPSKMYLGDSVYAEVVNGMLRLTTENDGSANNTIYLEPEVLTALFNYLELEVRWKGLEVKL